VADRPATDIVKVALNAVQMRHNRVLECSVRSNPTFGPVLLGQVAIYEGLIIGHQMEFGIVENQDVKRPFFGRVTVDAKDDVPPNDKVAPYFFKIVVEGYFDVPADPPDDIDVSQLVAVHGTAALTAVVRELLADITSRAVHGVFLIPSLVFSATKTPAEEKADKH
jgi:hypothetical protein